MVEMSTSTPTAEEKVLKAIQANLGLDSMDGIDRDTPLESLGADSMDIVALEFQLKLTRGSICDLWKGHIPVTGTLAKDAGKVHRRVEPVDPADVPKPTVGNLIDLTKSHEVNIDADA